MQNATTRPIRSVTRILLCALIGAVALFADAREMNLDRYPDRMPNWLWQGHLHRHLLSKYTREQLLRVTGNRSQRTSGTSIVDERETQLAAALNAAFDRKTLESGATLLKTTNSPLRVVVHVDPAFSASQRRCILESTRLFLQHAIDPEVTYASVVVCQPQTPEPTPRPHLFRNIVFPFEVRPAPCEPLPNEQGTAGRELPRDPQRFSEELGATLSPQDGIPPLLVISKLTGGYWWGNGRLNYYYDPACQLRGEHRHYFYIGLNGDRMASKQGPMEHAFWAGKIGHEILHNLGYSHPKYMGTEDRDYQNSAAMTFPFAYERAIQAASRRQSDSAPNWN